MLNWKQYCVKENSTIRQVIENINASSMQAALVVNEDFYLKGIVTDGDIRRAMLKELALETSVQEIMHRNPITFSANDSINYIISRIQEKKLRHAPIISSDGKLLNIFFLDDLLLKKRRNNFVVLMAGGLGMRLRPLTENIPKPLLKVGNKPLLETILQNFIKDGFYHFYFAVNYKSEMIENYFGNGQRWDVEIEYLHEKKRLGTAGALSLLPPKINEPIIVMNGDLLTNVDFGEFLDYHNSEQAIATMGVREYSWQIPYGVIEINENQISSITEKPIQTCYVNAGMYVLSPKALQGIIKEQYLDMPELFRGLIANCNKTTVYPIRDYWIDIGKLEDFNRARNEYADIFGKE